jgi:cation transport ATPase
MAALSTQRVTLPILDFGCAGSGALIVERALVHTPGVTRAYVNPATEMAYVEYDPARTDLSHLLAAIAHTGFRAGRPTSREEV